MSECVDLLDLTSDTHEQFGNITPFSSLSDPDPDLNAGNPGAVSGASASYMATTKKPGTPMDNSTSYTSSNDTDVLEQDVVGHAIGIGSGDIT